MNVPERSPGGYDGSHGQVTAAALRHAFVLFILLVACGPRITRATYTPPREEVVNWDTCLDIARCPAFHRFWRPSDPVIGRVSWVVSRSGHACVVEDSTYAIVHTGDLYACQWRLPRP